MAQAPKTNETTKRRASDPEIATLGKILALFGELEPAARKRVLGFVNERVGEQDQAAE